MTKGARVRSLQALSELKAAMQAAAAQREREAALRAAQARSAEAARNVFRSAVGPVHPLPAHGRAEVQRIRPPPVPVQRLRDEEAALREALSDEVDVESLLDTDGELSFRRADIAVDVVKRLRRGQWAIQAQVDLHGLRRDEAREALATFIRDAVRSGLRCVRVVHGKGHGSPGKSPVLKGKVRGWLVQKDDVIAFVQARASDGGHGALIVLLRPGA